VGAQPRHGDRAVRRLAARRLTQEMAELSERHRGEFVEPVRRAARRLSQSLQDFRNRLSERTLAALGVPLRTTEIELHTEDPRSPDVRVGKIFDRNWELLSFLFPMALLGGVVKRHFEGKVADAVFMNLSRLVSQWQEIAGVALADLEKKLDPPAGRFGRHHRETDRLRRPGRAANP